MKGHSRYGSSPQCLPARPPMQTHGTSRACRGRGPAPLRALCRDTTASAAPGTWHPGGAQSVAESRTAGRRLYPASGAAAATGPRATLHRRCRRHCPDHWQVPQGVPTQNGGCMMQIERLCRAPHASVTQNGMLLGTSGPACWRAAFGMKRCDCKMRSRMRSRIGERFRGRADLYCCLSS